MTMEAPQVDARLKAIITEAVNEALERQKASIIAAVLEAMADAELVRAMEEADSELADPQEVDRILNRRSRDG